MLHPDLLRSFLAIVDGQGFTAAGQLIGLRQSTISQHVSRLEETLGRKLLTRDTHRLALTPDGDALVGFARRVIEANDRMERFFTGSALRGSLRIGVSEDFALATLSRVLGQFAALQPSVDLQLTVGLSGTLYTSYDAGQLDIIFVKRRAGDSRGQLAWTEQLVWVGRPGATPDPTLPLPLVLYPPPSITRALAISTLEASGRAWRIACTSSSLTGLLAAAAAGLGLTPHSARLLPPGLSAVPAGSAVPELGQIEFVALGPGPQHRVATALIDLMLASAREDQAARPLAIGPDSAYMNGVGSPDYGDKRSLE